MDKQNVNAKLNHYLITSWGIISGVLLVAYFGEYLKGTLSMNYILSFYLATFIPPAIGIILYSRKKDSDKLKFFVLAGYFIMYAFVLITGSTMMVFTYILPMLTVMVFLHQPRLLGAMWAVTMVFNIAFDIRLFLEGRLTVENSRDVEIQLCVIMLCFGFLYSAAKLYDDISKKNEDYCREIEEKNRQIQRVTLQTITTIAKIIDAKDEYTKGHSQRVAEYSSAIAREMGYTEEQVQNVKYIGLLHDIGKIGIPDTILNKPGRLSDAEFSIMKQHVEIGCNILKDNHMIDGLDEGARYHHERYDGSGYNLHLKGKDIPEVARIIGIADAYDAMTSNRIYRKRLTDEDVISEIERCSGTQFDPEITEIFVRLLRENRLDILTPDTVSEDPTGLEEQSAKLLRSIIDINTNRSSRSDSLDYLTDAYNRKSGEGYICQMLSALDGMLILVDIMNIRETNSRYGFVGGDRLIKIVSDVLLNFNDKMITARFDGDQFLCFISGVKTEYAAEELLGSMHESIMKAIRENPNYDINNICIGAVLSSMAGRDYNDLIICADKALYYMKQLKKAGWYLYRTSDIKRDDRQNLSKHDLDQLISIINKQSSYEGTYNVDYPEFVKIYDFIRSVGLRNHHDVQVILLTLCANDEKNTSIEERDLAMHYLEKAIDTSLRKVDIMMRFSSTQCIIFLMNLSNEQIQIVTNRIMNMFYKIYDKKNMILSYDVADLNTEPDGRAEKK